jgi:hypothetical protein
MFGAYEYRVYHCVPNKAATIVHSGGRFAEAFAAYRGTRESLPSGTRLYLEVRYVNQWQTMQEEVIK